MASDALQRLEKMIERRAREEPLAYITGWKEFWSMEFKVNEHTLIPRADSESIIEAILVRVLFKDGTPLSQKMFT